MKDGKKLVYSGDSLRRFLHRKGLTYKDAAKELGLDKNTIGKAVRGGNMNINVLLSIANHWNFPITDFFIFVNQEECEETYFISPNKYNNDSANDNLLVSEDSKIYKNIKNLSTEELALKASKQQEISLLQNLIRNYQVRTDTVQDSETEKQLKEDITEYFDSMLQTRSDIYSIIIFGTARSTTTWVTTAATSRSIFLESNSCRIACCKW